MKANPALKFIRKNLSGSPSGTHSGTPSGWSLPTQQEIVKWKQELPYEANLRVLFFFHAEDLVCFPSREPKVMNRIYHYSFHCKEKTIEKSVHVFNRSSTSFKLWKQTDICQLSASTAMFLKSRCLCYWVLSMLVTSKQFRQLMTHIAPRRNLHLRAHFRQEMRFNQVFTQLYILSF